MTTPRANAISRLLAARGFNKADAKAPGVTVYQTGNTCVVYDHGGELEEIKRALEICGYSAEIEIMGHGRYAFVRVAGQ